MKSQTDLIMLYTSIASGIEKNITSDTTLDGVVYTPAQLQRLFADVAVAVENARTQLERYHDAVLAEHAALERGAVRARLLRSILLGQYGEQANEKLGEFGMTVPKPRGARTVSAKAQGIARRALTRQVRHTMGSEQKKALKGMVEVPYDQVPTTPAAPPAALVRAETQPKTG